MLIDWFTVIAQVVNFLILVWLMKKFLYKPILGAIESREKKIAAELADADKKKQEAKEESDEFKRKNEEIDKERASLLAKASDEANSQGKQMLNEARKTADDLKISREEVLRNDFNNLNQMISDRMQKEVFSITKKVLVDLSGMSLEERMVQVFIHRLKELNKEKFNEILEASADKPFLIYSAFDLSVENKAEIQNVLNLVFSIEVQIKFKTKPELISGIELVMNGQKLAWSIEEYLVSLENSIGNLVDAKSL
jgi:F-type H+-transporting ATPase subunit b